MTALHILTSEYPPDLGGVSDYTRQVAEALARDGEEVHVWCPPTSEPRETSGVRVHAEAGRFRRSDLRRLTAALDSCPSPRRLLVQWVPHGFGYRSMNLPFCLWLAGRAAKGDSVELMVHEPFIELRWGPLRHIAIAIVHRVMTMVLMASAEKVWVAIPAWESCLRPYAFGRSLPVELAADSSLRWISARLAAERPTQITPKAASHSSGISGPTATRSHACSLNDSRRSWTARRNRLSS